MFSEEDLERIKERICQININSGKNDSGNRKEKSGGNKNDANNCFNLNPSEILALAGILSGVLEVSSITVTRDQIVDVSLSGSLQRKTQLEQIMEQIGKCSFEEVMQAIIGSMK